MITNTSPVPTIILIHSSLLAVLLLALYIDYRRHKAPLVAVDPQVHYSFAHHLRVVTLPLFRYRLQIRIQKISGSNAERKF